MNNEHIPSRSELPEETKWAITDIYPTDADWENDLQRLKEMGKSLASFKGRLSAGGKDLYECLETDTELSVLADSLGNYAQRRSDEDTRASKYQDFCGRFMSAVTEINSNCAFISPEILAIDDKLLDGFYKDEPRLELYRLQIDRIRRQREHILSDREERILSLSSEMSQAPENIYSMFSDADLKFPDATDSSGKPHQVTHGTYIPLMQSPDRQLRKNAFKSMYSTYEGFKNTVAATLSAQCKYLTFRSRARHYGSNLEAALFGNEIPTEVYKNLIGSVHDNMEYMYRYVRLRKKLLGVDELHFYDLYTPIVPDCDIRVSYEEAKSEIAKALSPLGEDYISILNEGFNNRWCDVYENEGKCSGAYSAGARVHPFVLLNYTDTLNDEFTVAHEMGHAIHSYLSNKHQPAPYSDYVIFVAEVASTCNEALLMEYLLKNAGDKKRRAYLINYFLEQFRTTLYRQTMFAEFELTINQMAQNGESLTSDALCDIYRDLNKLYFGEDIVIDDEIAMEWARIPHFYYNFYVYQYATGYAAAIALSQRILSGGKPAADAYKQFLSGGCSKTPIELLRGAGVDMATAQPVNDALKLMGKLLDELEDLLS